MFEQASRQKLRFNTTIGLITTEDLWDLKLEHLNTLAKSLNKALKESDEEDFLEDLSKEDEELKLRFEIVKHILSIKKQEVKKVKEAKARKDEKEKLLSILEKKQGEALEELSVDELQSRIKELS